MIKTKFAKQTSRSNAEGVTTVLDSSMVEHSAVNRRVAGSSPARGVRPGGQEVKTSPFHGGNTGSIPVRVTQKTFHPECLQTEDKVRGLRRGLRLLNYKSETRLPIRKTAFYYVVVFK